MRSIVLCTSTRTGGPGSLSLSLNTGTMIKFVSLSAPHFCA